jgi:hypothetical protein
MASDETHRLNSDRVSNLTHTFILIDDPAQFNASETLTPPKLTEETMQHSDWKFGKKLNRQR